MRRKGEACELTSGASALLMLANKGRIDRPIPASGSDLPMP